MSNHTEECSGCLAEYNGECTAETCRGKITQLAHNSGKYTDSKEPAPENVTSCRLDIVPGVFRRGFR